MSATSHRTAYVKIPLPLWDKLQIWRKKQGCNTTAEGIRTAIREVLQDGGADCQENSEKK